MTTAVEPEASAEVARPPVEVLGEVLSELQIAQLMDRIKRLIESGEIKLIYLDRFTPRAADAAYRREIAEIKRILERWAADPAFRARLESDPVAAIAEMDLAIDVRDIIYLWDRDTVVNTPIDDIPLPALRYRTFILEKITHRNRMRMNDPTMDPRFVAWRTRQMRRLEDELSASTASSIVHAPFSIELCDGCSVGCWFCGISAPRLETTFTHTPENAALFDGVIAVMQELLGDAAGRGFLYWATDPIDNADYEKFMVDFHARTGSFPQTTTALALKDIERTRALLALSVEKGGMMDRFSLLALKQLERVHREFTAEELLYVELVTQNRENHQPKARAGRALSGFAPGRTAETAKTGEAAVDGTIACVSGFLINMVKREVRLISPCRADERRPLGYITLDGGSFSSTEEFRALVFGMVERHMPVRLRGNETLSFFEHLAIEQIDGGVRSVGKRYVMAFNDESFAGVAHVLRDGPAQTDDVIAAAARNGVGDAEALYALNLLVEHAVLDVRGGAARG